MVTSKTSDYIAEVMALILAIEYVLDNKNVLSRPKKVVFHTKFFYILQMGKTYYYMYSEDHS